MELTSRYMSFQMFFPGEALPTVRAKEHLRTGVCVATGLAKYTRSHELNASGVVDPKRNVVSTRRLFRKRRSQVEKGNTVFMKGRWDSGGVRSLSLFNSREGKGVEAALDMR